MLQVDEVQEELEMVVLEDDLENRILVVEEEMDLATQEDDLIHVLLELVEVHEEVENHLEGKVMDGRSKNLANIIKNYTL